MEVQEEFSVPGGSELWVDCLGLKTRISLRHGSLLALGCTLYVGAIHEFPVGTNLFLSCPKEFTQGARVLIEGTVETNLRNTTTSARYSDLIDFLNATRTSCRRLGSSGPRVLVCGPPSCGKSTLCQLLCNEAIANDHSVVYVDGSLTSNSLAPPGCFSAAFLEEFITPGTGLRNITPLSYFAGSSNFPDGEFDISHWKEITELLKAMYLVIQQIMSQRTRFREGGLVVELPSSLFPMDLMNSSAMFGTEKSYVARGLLAFIMSFEISYVCILGGGTACQKFIVEACNNVQLPASVIVRQFDRLSFPHPRKCVETSPLSTYFTGRDGNLMYFRLWICFEDVNVVMITNPECDFNRHSKNNVGQRNDFLDLRKNIYDLRFTLAAVSTAAKDNEVRSASIAGIVLIVNIYPELAKIEVISPDPGPLPSPYLVVSPVMKVPHEHVNQMLTQG